MIRKDQERANARNETKPKVTNIQGSTRGHYLSYCTLDKDLSVFLLERLRKLGCCRLAVEYFVPVGAIEIREERS